MNKEDLLKLRDYVFRGDLDVERNLQAKRFCPILAGWIDYFEFCGDEKCESCNTTDKMLKRELNRQLLIASQVWKINLK